MGSHANVPPIFASQKVAQQLMSWPRNQWCSGKFGTGGTPGSPLPLPYPTIPSSPLVSLLLPFTSLPFPPFLPLEVGPLNATRGSEGAV